MFRRFAFLLVFLVGFSSFQLSSQVKLPRLISDGMVLQQNTKINVWGWASANEKVNLKFAGNSYTCSANSEGEWSIWLPPMKAGGPYTMQISGSNEIVINDILIGEVWVCSGQSQMDINMDRVSPLYQEEISKAGNPNIRNFVVPVSYNFERPQKDVQSGKWEPVTRNNILSISAIAYFFATELYEKYKVPVGIIRSSVGGSPAEAWISEASVKQFPVHYNELLKFKSSAYIDSLQQTDRARENDWYARLAQADQGYKDPDKPWHSPEMDVTKWKKMNVPGYWADGELGPVNGVLWFRKNITVPEELAGKQGKLLLGRIVDADSVFVNGKFVGTTSYMYPPRRYKIPENLLKGGKNTIVIKLISNGGIGGFVLDKPYELIIGDEKIDLKGQWHYSVGAKMEPLRGETTIRYKPSGLFNAMISPLSNYQIKGVLWYQGESNAGRPQEYARLLPALITDWRKSWKTDELPFLFVQLHNFMEKHDIPTESSWALTRESQAKALSLPNTGMAVAIDLGEWNDIHPLNKRDVAKRLALVAYKVGYKENIVYSGPVYQSMKIEKHKVVLSFSNVGNGLVSKGGGDLKYFAIAGPDKKFVWAKATIKGNKVIVWNDTITNPVAVRYAWADNPDGANLYNKEGLPAAPFRTDNF